MRQILRLLLKGMLRTTVTKIGLKDSDRAIRLSVAIMTIAVLAANLFGFLAVRQIGQEAATIGAPFAIAVLWFQAAGIVVLAQNIGVGQSQIAKGLQLVPLTPIERVIAVSLPVALIAGLSCATLLLPAAAATWTYSPLDPISSIILCLAVTVTGACVGFACWAAAATICEANRRFLRSRTYPVSILLLTTVVSLSLPTLGHMTDQAPPGATNLPDWFSALYFWPLIAEHTLNPDIYWIALALPVGIITVVGTGVAAVKVAPLLLRDEAPQPRRFSWANTSRLPLYRLELVRLARNRRTMTAVATTAAMGIVGIMGAFLNERRGITDIDVAPVIGVLMTIPAAQITLLARGATTNRFPYHLQLGFRPTGWALALNGAALTIAVAAVTPLMIGLWYAPGVDTIGLRVVIAYQLVVFAGTAAFGSAARPGRDNPAGEFIGLLLVSAAAAAGITSLVTTYGGDHPSLIVLTVTVIAATVPVPALIEHRRWTQLVGS